VIAEPETNDKSPVSNNADQGGAFKWGIFTGPTKCKCGKLLMVERLYGRYRCPSCHDTRMRFTINISFKLLFINIVILWFILVLKQAEFYLIGLFGVAIVVAFIVIKDDVLKENEINREQRQKWEADGRLIAERLTKDK